MDINAMLAGVSIGAITFGGVLKGIALILIGMILIRIIMKIVDTSLDMSKDGCSSFQSNRLFQIFSNFLCYTPQTNRVRASLNNL